MDRVENVDVQWNVDRRVFTGTWKEPGDRTFFKRVESTPTQTYPTSRFVENNWASKDYTHLSFRGGKEIASALLKAILLEKEFYDEADKVAH